MSGAIERRALWLAEDAARELPNLPLEDALYPLKDARDATAVGEFAFVSSREEESCP